MRCWWWRGEFDEGAGGVSAAGVGVRMHLVGEGYGGEEDVACVCGGRRGVCLDEAVMGESDGQTLECLVTLALEGQDSGGAPDTP